MEILAQVNYVNNAVRTLWEASGILISAPTTFSTFSGFSLSMGQGFFLSWGKIHFEVPTEPTPSLK